MNPKDMEQERRKQRRLEKLGTQNPNMLSARLRPRLTWRCLELHHGRRSRVRPQSP